MFDMNEGDVELQLDGDQEKMWEQSMSQIINEMKVQLQRDLSGQQAADGTDQTPFGEAMERFVDSERFERALAYRSDNTKRKGAAEVVHGNESRGK